MTGWTRNDPMTKPASIKERSPAVSAEDRAAELNAQADFLASRGQHEAADILRDEAAGILRVVTEGLK